MDKVKWVYGMVRQVLQMHGVLNQNLQEKIIWNVLYYIFLDIKEMRKTKKECVVIVVERDKDDETKILGEEFLFVDDYFNHNTG
jgi:hypothetical protein